MIQDILNLFDKVTKEVECRDLRLIDIMPALLQLAYTVMTLLVCATVLCIALFYAILSTA